jgi:hypothetical protein
MLIPLPTRATTIPTHTVALKPWDADALIATLGVIHATPPPAASFPRAPHPQRERDLLAVTINSLREQHDPAAVQAETVALSDSDLDTIVWALLAYLPGASETERADAASLYEQFRDLQARLSAPAPTTPPPAA